ncbi:family 16 glycoside hydrolase [Mariniphaga sediminis]|nr:family 16 glycoside hydrolase [Mariniphaga sediminis]
MKIILIGLAGIFYSVFGYSLGHQWNANGADRTPQASLTPLFNGKDLSGWYTYLEGRGRDSDPKGVFTVSDGIIRISGEEWGSLTTGKEYANYHLTLEFKWGDKTFAPRKDNARDGGVLIHSQGADGAYDGKWMHSIECQIIEGGTGDILVVGDGSDNFSVTSTIKSGKGPKVFEPAGSNPITITGGRIDWPGRDPSWKDVLGFRGVEDVEHALGEWNTLEIIANGGDIKVFLNNRMVNHVWNSTPSKGRIQLQSEGAEMFFRRIDLVSLPRDFRFSYNSDANNMFVPSADSPEDFYPYVDEVAAAGVTSFFMSPNWGMPMNYPTKVGDMIGEYISEELEEKLSQPILNVRTLVAEGHDPLGLILDRARAHRMETFVSFRLNEVHAVEQEDNVIFDRFWREHPEWRIGKPGDPLSQIYIDILGPRTNPVVNGWLPGGLNFAAPEVREYRLAQLREVCERYDIEGLELDFQRFPMYFKPGEEKQGIGIMTGWMREVRSMVEEVGKKRGRSLLLAARILALPEQNRAIGLDPVSWARDGILDVVIAAHYLHNNFQLPVDEYRQLLPGDVPVYASVEVEPTIEQYRNIAYPLWQKNVSGIYLFNFFTSREGGKTPPYKSIREMGYPVIAKDTVLLVANKHSNTLSYINPKTFEVETTIPTGPNPHEIIVTPDHRYAYLSNYAPPGNTISVIDLVARKHIKQIHTGEYGRIHGTAMSPDGRYAYFTAGQSGYVIEIDTQTHEVRRTIPTHGKISHMVYVSPDGKYLLTSNIVSEDISVINRFTGELYKKIPAGKGVEGMAFTPDRKHLWALNQSGGSITIIDMQTLEPVETFDCPGMPVRIRFTADGKRALIPGWTKEGTLTVIDVATRKEIKRIRVGDYAIGTELSPDEKYAFVGCEDAGKVETNKDGEELITVSEKESDGVHVVNLETLEVETVIKTGLGPDPMIMWYPPVY